MTDSVAIVGMACRFPDANSLGELWENVLAQRQSFRRIPPERLRLEDYLAQNRSTPDSTYSSEAALLEGFEFDRQHFRVAGSLYRTVDPSHWLALDVATQALNDAGYEDGQQIPRDMTGVIVGNTLTGDFSRAALMRLRWPFVRRVVETELMKEDWTTERRHSFLNQLGTAYKSPFLPVGEETLAGSLANTIAGRICNYYDLRGGGYIVDGACASSLIAISTACALLVSRDLDVALAGGVDLSLDPFELVGFAKVGALASDRMRVYDERSEGFLPGEGCGFVVLMRHRDAVAQGRRIYAVIRGWGISSDGHGGMTRPEVEGQRMAIERAYRRAGFSPKTVGYFEGHGTGTSVGDQTEINALSRAISKRGTRATMTAGLGSVKANIGHTKAAAGVAGLIKAAMAVFTQLLPPTSGCEDPHPTLKTDAPALKILKEGGLWPANNKLRAGINGLGFGGINAHIVLEGNATLRRVTLTDKEKKLLASAQDAELFLLSARDATELLQQVEHLSSFAANISRSELTDLAATLEDTLQSSNIRAAVVADTPTQLATRLKKLQALLVSEQSAHLDVKNGVFLGAGSQSPRIGFLFPGQGAPLHLSGGAFKRCFEFVRELYANTSEAVKVTGTEVAQPAILRATLAGLRAMNALGLQAEIAVGHSLGELAALCWAGALSEEALLRIGVARGSAMMEAQKPAGAMASINADSEKVRHLLNGDQIVMAGLNAPQNTVVAGEAQAVASFVERVKSEGLTAIMLPVSHAFHSPLMEESVAKIARHLEGESFGALQGAVVSTVTGNFIAPDEDLRQLLVRQITAPVRFMEAMDRASEKLDLLIEVGPGRILGGLVHGFLNTPVISLDAGSNSVRGLLQAVGAAFAAGAQINHHAIFEKRFSRPFNLDWRPRFLVNPCELAPVAGDFAPDAEGAAVALDGRQQPAADEQQSENPAEADVSLISGSPLELFRRLVAERLELSHADVRDDDRLLGDLHLNSIAVSQLVTETAKHLGLTAPASPTEYSTFTVGAVGQALEELLGTGATSFETGTQTAGVDTWVRTFTVELVETPRQRRPLEKQAGAWQVLGTSGCAFTDALRRAFAEAQIGDGVCVVLPDHDEAARLSLLLNGARAVIAEKGPAKFVLVKQNGSGAAFVRTLHLEAAGNTTCVLTVPVAHPRAVEWVIAEARDATGYVEAHYDASGARREPVLTLLPSSEKPSEVGLDRQDVMVVSGGGKGIAAECALSLAAQTGVRLVLLGRSKPDEDEELAGNLARIAALHINYSYESVDVTDKERVHSILRRVEKKFGPITAFVHGAGANVPQLITALDEAAVRRTLAPKIDGARNILAAIDPSKLRLFVSFSSLIARTGMRGEADYALANELLTQMTEDWHASHPHCKCLAVEWSIWSGVGMGERLGRVDALWRQGITPISPAEGLRVLDDLLCRDQPSVAVVVAGRFGEMPTLRSQQAELPFQRFLEKTLTHVPGVELIVEFEATTDSDPYLKDHMYQGDPLFPSVMGLEAMAQVSMALMETERLPVFENVKFNRPIVVPASSSTQIRIAALKRTSDSVEVVIRCDGSGFHVDHFSATCRFAEGDAETDARKLPAASMKSERACAALIPERHLYGEILFQSGRLQRLQSYRYLRARECVAEIRATEPADWFSSYLPTGLMLGDPAVRDASLHAIQACIPHQTILPVAVERIVVSSVERGTGTVLLKASERSQEGKRFIYDLEIADEDGTVRERWEGLHLHRMEAISLTNYTWVEPLLGTYVERRLDELLAGAGVSVVFERDGVSARRARSDRAIQMCAGTETVHRRADGRPVVAGELTVSASHAEDLTMAIAGRGSLACDVERAVPHSHTYWRELLGEQRSELARLIAAEGSEDEAAAATRVWTACESLKKAGAGVGVPMMLHSIANDGWVQLQAGGLLVATYIAKIAGVDERMAIAVCGEGAQTGVAN